MRRSGNVAERTLPVAGLSSNSVRSKGMRRSRTSGTCRIDRGEGQQRAKKSRDAGVRVPGLHTCERGPPGAKDPAARQPNLHEITRSQ